LRILPASRLLERENAEMPQRQDILLDETYRHVANSLQTIASIICWKGELGRSKAASGGHA
jgi:two-component sensor histidine kinase